MPAPLLRRYASSLTTTSPFTVVAAVASARALVGKILVAASGSSTITLTVGGTNVVTALAMSAGQVYTETGLVVLAGETVTATAGTASQLVVTVFGEEVDNG